MIEHGFTTRQVAEASGLSPSKISHWARAGLVSPAVTSRGDAIFSFQDVVLFRTARELLNADVPERKIRAAVAALRRQLPSDLPLSSLRISANGDEVLVQDDQGAWAPATGQLQIDFASPMQTAASVTPVLAERGDDTRAAADARSADHWYDAGVDMEASDPAAAVEAYRRALAVEPRHPDAHLNLGRLLHEAGELEAAETHYRAAVDVAPDDAGARYNLGVVLEDLKQWSPAIAAYREALRLDDELAAAHFNLARLLQAKGRAAEALRHLTKYRSLAG